MEAGYLCILAWLSKDPEWILTLFTATGFARGPLNAITWAIFILIQSLTLPAIVLKGFQSFL